jgi:hypothetical protein
MSKSKMSGKLNLGGIDLVKLYGELRWIEDKADRFPNLFNPQNPTYTTVNLKSNI